MSTPAPHRPVCAHCDGAGCALCLRAASRAAESLPRQVQP